MHATVARHFGVKRRGKHVILPHRDGLAVMLGERLDSVAHARDLRRANKYHADIHAVEIALGNKAD